MLPVQPLAIPDVKLLQPKKHGDARGYLAEVSQERELKTLGLPLFVQENQSLSARKFTLRGLHAQRAPHAQAKLVRVLRGRIFDVAVDARPNSPTFGKHATATLNSDDLTQMYIPAGFLHGFCTLEEDTVVLYKISDYYAPGSEIGAIWNDPALGIDWPAKADETTLSDKDAILPPFAALPRIDW